MFRHLLIPLDFSAKNKSAIQIAAELAIAGQARITLLHVIESLDEDLDDELDDFYGKLEARARGRLDRVQAELARKGVAAVETAVTVGKRADEIVAHAMRHGVDLIILSSHSVQDSAEERRLWPTISHRVALLSPIPVLLVR